jgi:RNA 2',3'-cyclic 3'-phosphodiesterase
MTMIRLFTALDIPAGIQDRLYDMAREISEARSVPRQQLHLTLKFIGEVPEEMLQSIREAMAAVSVAPFNLALQGMGRFPARGPARIVWAGCKAESRLQQLFSALEEVLEPLGIARERRNYFPHITIARLKHPSPAALREFLERHAAFATGLFEVQCFSLYSSRLTSQGAEHKVEGCYRLAG